MKGGSAVADIPRDFSPLFAKHWSWLSDALAFKLGGVSDSNN